MNREREQSIEFHMNYCQHYVRGEGVEMVCSAGMDLKTIKRVDTGNKIKWGPCIEGHTLENPHAHCPHWIRNTRESAEKYADDVQTAINRMEITLKIIAPWRKKLPFGKSEVIECPICKGKLYLTQSSYNGHVHAKCETSDCVSWME